MATEPEQSPNLEGFMKALLAKLERDASQPLENREIGYQSLLTPVRPRRVRKSMFGEEHWKRLRKLPDGGLVKIVNAGANAGFVKYVGQTARKLRTPGAGAYRMLVQLDDGVRCSWPMDGLAPVHDGSPQT